MPTYAYACTQCEHHFEIVQSFTDDTLTVCPECEGRLRKLFNTVGIVFKGSGFYRTDSRGAEPSGSKSSASSTASGDAGATKSSTANATTTSSNSSSSSASSSTSSTSSSSTS